MESLRGSNIQFLCYFSLSSAKILWKDHLPPVSFSSVGFFSSIVTAFSMSHLQVNVFPYEEKRGRGSMQIACSEHEPIDLE